LIGEKYKVSFLVIKRLIHFSGMFRTQADL